MAVLFALVFEPAMWNPIGKWEFPSPYAAWIISISRRLPRRLCKAHPRTWLGRPVIIPPKE